jgi:hypothetical protein
MSTANVTGLPHRALASADIRGLVSGMACFSLV